MNRTFIILFMAAVAAFAATAQTAMPQSQAKELAERINTVASSISTMQCGFEQVKELSILKDKMVSEGTMCYRSPNQLRWEYTSPYAYRFILDGDKVTMDNGRTSNTVDIRSSRMFQEIARIMMGSVTGRCIGEGSDFKAAYYTSPDGGWIVRLTPVKKQLKHMFKDVALHISATTSMVSEIEMTENNGDRTVIRFKDIKINKPLDDSVFKVH